MRRKKARSVHHHASLNVTLERLRGVIFVPERCAELARDEASRSRERRTYQRTPLLALLTYYSRPMWLRALADNEHLREILVDVLGRVAHQLDQVDNAATSERTRTADIACRAARRYLLLVALRPDLAEYEVCVEYVEEIVALPSLSGAPGGPCIPRSLSCIAGFVKALRCFRSGVPILGCHVGSREPANETFETFVDQQFLRGRFADLGSTRWSCLDPLRPVVIDILRECRIFLAAQQYDHRLASHYLVALLSIYYGLDYRDALVLRIGRPPTSAPSPGFLDLSSGWLVRRLGSGFYPGDGSFCPSELALPLVPEIAKLAGQLGLRMDGTLLREQLGLEMHVGYGRWLRRRKSALLKRMQLSTTSLHFTFDFVGLFKSGLYACELSLLRAAPRYGATAECSYVCMTENELVGHWNNIIGVIRRWAKLPVWRGSVAEPTRVHGTPSMTLTSYVEIVREHMGSAMSRNELLVAIEGLYRCLGRRNSLRHENAASCVRGFPEPALQIVDKWSNGRPLGMRYLPMVEPVAAFAELCAQHCGGGRLTAYEATDGGWCPSDKVGGNLGHWLHMGPARQAARTALFNDLRRRRIPAAVMNAAMGHSTELTWESALSPLPNAVLFTQLREVLMAILEECGFARAVAELRKALDRYSAAPQAIGGEAHPGSRAISAAAPFSPLTEIEDYLACRMVTNLDRECLPETGWATAVYFAMELGVPFRLLARNARYVTFRSLVADEASERIFFFAPIEGEDVGHLDFFPVEIPKNSVAWRHLLARWQDIRSCHRLARACLDTPIFGDEECMEDKVGKYLSRLASEGGKRLRLDDCDAVRLLERLSAALCRHWQCGSVAGALAMEIPFGINQIDITQTISLMTGRPAVLRDMDGEIFSGRLFQRGQRRAVPVSERRAHYLKFLDRLAYTRWPRELADEAEQARYLYELLRNEDVTPARDRFREVAMRLGSPKSAAARVARLATQLAHRHGALEPTSPEVFPTEEAMRNARGKIGTRTLDIRHKDPETRLRRIENTARSLEMLFSSGCRLSESILTLETELIEEPEWTAHYIYESKTDAGRRMVLPGEFTPSWEGSTPRAPLCNWRRRNRNLKRAHNRNYLEAEKVRLQRQVKGIIGDEFHPHTLRHYRAYLALLTLFERHWQNSVQMLASIARMFGHASAFTFLNAYVGTLLACFSIPHQPCPSWVRNG